MSKSWNHRWRKIIDAPAPCLHRWGDGEIASWHDHECTTVKCHGKQIVAQIAYDYVTGQRGRVTYARKCVCEDHLAKFLKKNPAAIEGESINYTNRHLRFLPIAEVKP